MFAVALLAAFLAFNTYAPQPQSAGPDFCQIRGGQDDDTGRRMLWPSAACGDAGAPIVSPADAPLAAR